MKKILIFILFLISISASAQKWYVATTGSDSHGQGTLADPWLTVKHAADTITAANGFAGDTIVVGAGTFSEPVQPVLSVGISLIGQQVSPLTSTITSANALDPIILLASETEGTDGNQSISYLKFDGNSLTAVRGVAVWRRSNVSIHHCTFEDFLSQGASFRGQTNSTGGPTIYATGNKFYNNIITNCSRYTTFGTGCLEIGGQQGMLIYNDTITVEDRGGTSHGYGIKGSADGYYKGLKIYDNVITVPEFENTGYNFSIELWSQRGGVEIYRNTLKGAIDIGGWDTYDDGGYGFAVKIYENTIGYDANQTYSTSGIYLEPAVRDGIYIYRNYFKNMKYGIRLNPYTGDIIPGMNDIYISYNIFYNLRESAAGLTGFGIVSYAADPPAGYQSPIGNLNILNNIFHNPTAGTMNTVIWIRGYPDVTDIQIRNNIVYNTYNGVTFASCTVNGLNIDNNIFYNATHNDILFETTTVTNSSTNNNLTSDPLWVGGSPYSYKLQANSPAKDAGMSVGLTKDYGNYNVPVGNLPDIGVWEYGADVTPNLWTPQGIGWEPNYFKVNQRDTMNFRTQPLIAGTPLGDAILGLTGITSTINDLNATAGATGNLQGQINTLHNGKLEKINAPLATGTITDATGITAAMLSRYMYYSEAAATDISANPQIADGTPGQIITIIGSSDTNTLTLDDTDGLRLSAQCVLGIGDTITLFYDGTIGDWIEIGRSEN